MHDKVLRNSCRSLPQLQLPLLMVGLDDLKCPFQLAWFCHSKQAQLPPFAAHVPQAPIIFGTFFLSSSCLLNWERPENGHTVAQVGWVSGDCPVICWLCSCWCSPKHQEHAGGLAFAQSLLQTVCHWLASVSSPVEKHICMTTVVLGVLRALDLL